MLPTHALVGLAMAAPLVAIAPDLAPAGLAGAFAGSLLPDSDMYAGHRRSLHFPTAYAAAAGPLLAVALVWPGAATVAIALFATGAALHCRMDRYGGGLELRPWEGTSDRAVYDHVRGRWRSPKRWVRYDGAPEDVLLGVLVGVPLLVVLEGPFRLVVVTALVVGSIYGLLRRRLADLAPAVVPLVPSQLTIHVPERYQEGGTQRD